MRKYRGKRKSDGKWVYGYLGYKYENLDGFYVIGENVDEVARVLPETIGEETGLKDKNEKEIYEGDIVEYNKIMWNNDNRIKNEIAFERGIFRLKGSTSLSIVCSPDFESEVIGNIHEHSELIKD